MSEAWIDINDWWNHDRDTVDWVIYKVAAKGWYKLRAATMALWLEVLAAFDEVEPPMTVRQVYYALVSRGAVGKTEAAYDRVGTQLLRMRRCGVLPYEWIADSTRWMRKPATWTGLRAFMEHGQAAYRRAIWDTQAAYVEVWCEKDALAGVVSRVTARFDVPLMVTRGYPSESFVYAAAEVLKSKVKPVFLYYLGDHDPSGRNIPENTQRKLRDFGAHFTFEVLAVLPWQIDAWNLQTRPTKKKDPRAADFEGGSVELDAIPAGTLRKLVEDAIEQHLDHRILEDVLTAERLERRTFDEVLRFLG